MISLQKIINSSASLRFAAALAQRLPPRIGYQIAAAVADLIALQRSSRLVRAIRANQWVVTGEALDEKALDRAVRETLHHSARCIFDLYHYIENPAATEQMIVLEPSFLPFARRPEFERRGDRRGVMIVGVHLSNFDLVLQWLCRQGLKPLALTLPDPQGGRRMEYEMRKRTGMNILPASVSALRQAIRHLQRGGMVVTGIDRPIPNPEVRPRFFNRPAALPVHHVFLAMKARVPVIITVATLQQDGKYHVFASDPIEMDPYPYLDADVAMLRNAEKVLAVAEEFIRRYPQQWTVPLPVWHEALDR